MFEITIINCETGITLPFKTDRIIIAAQFNERIFTAFSCGEFTPEQVDEIDDVISREVALLEGKALDNTLSAINVLEQTWAASGKTPEDLERYLNGMFALGIAKEP